MMIGMSAISQPKKKEEKMPIQVIIKRKLIIDKPEEYMVISTWETADDWKTRSQSKERRNIQGRVDSLIGERTHYSIYEDLTQ